MKEKSSKLPALQFYPGDWKKDPGVQSLDYFERGVWLEILLMMHESEERGYLLLNGKPMSINRLSTLLGLDNQKTTTVVNSLLETGVASQREDGAIFSRRMVRDEKIRRTRTEAGKKGGNPNLVNQKSTTQVNQIPTPSSSSSSSSSDRSIDLRSIDAPEIDPPETPKSKPRKNPTKFDPKTSLSAEQYQAILDDKDLAAGNREWLKRQVSTMADHFGDRRMADWKATLRNWCRKARYQFGDAPNQSAPARAPTLSRRERQIQYLKQSILEDTRRTG